MKITESNLKDLIRFVYKPSSPMTYSEKKAQEKIQKIIKNVVLTKMMKDDELLGTSEHGTVNVYISDDVWHGVEMKPKVISKISKFIKENGLSGIWSDIHNIKITW